MKTTLTLAAVVGCGLLAGWADAGRAQTPPPPSANRLADMLQPFVDARQIAGAVTMVADKDGVLDVTCVGDADVGTKMPMQADTLFWIASQSKPIAATALMILVDEGKVNVDDPVEKYLPAFQGQMVVAEHDDAHTLLQCPPHAVTVRNLLTHTSGLAFSSPLEGPTLDTLPLRVAVGSYATIPLQFPPDTQYRYSNAGFNTVGRIVEVVSGMPYEDFLRTRIFEPLGMKDTTFWPDAGQIRRLAKSYRQDAKESGLREIPVEQVHYPLDDHANRYPFPAGGLFSTAADCARLCRMLLNGGELDGQRVLSAGAVHQMTTRQTPQGIATPYGFGWSINGETFGHGGAYVTDMSVDPARGLVMIYLVQHAGFAEGAEAAKTALREAAQQRFTGKAAGKPANPRTEP